MKQTTKGLYGDDPSRFTRPSQTPPRSTPTLREDEKTTGSCLRSRPSKRRRTLLLSSRAEVRSPTPSPDLWEIYRSSPTGDTLPKERTETPGRVREEHRPSLNPVVPGVRRDPLGTLRLSPQLFRAL